ncbi:bifunctional lysylphosphatidylglycerol flippase/synthetase MprF [Enterococcus olivae]
MKTISSWITQHKTLLKSLFVIILLIIVSGELLSIAKTISFEQLRLLFSEISLWRFALMLAIGLLAVFPMMGYDFTLKKIVALENTTGYLMETSWIVNTLNNIAGFGGVISVGLRSEFYGKKGQSKEIFHALAKILLFALSGLSIYSLLSFIAIYFFHTNPYVQQYWLWLIIGSGYFPLLYLITTLKKTGFLGGLARRFRLALLLSSFLEWTGVITAFLSIGYLMGISFSIWEVTPLFVSAIVIGIISMIPGALGTFDVMMILGLSSLGIEREVVVLWLLLFRLCYYFVPAIIGLLFFFKHLFSNFDEKYDGIPKQLTLEFFHKIEVGLLYFSGIMMVLLATVPQAFTDFPWLSHLNPFRFRLIVQFPSILIGFTLLIMGRGIAARVKRAYWPTLLLIGTAILYSFLIDFSWITIVYLILLFMIIVVSKSELFREQLVYSWEWLTIDGIVFGILTLLYLILGVVQLPELPHRHPHHLMNFVLLPSEKIWLSGFIVFGTVALCLLLLIRWLEGPKKKAGSPLDQAIVQKILDTYGGNSDSELVFLQDKALFVYPNKEEATVFLQFNTWNNKCVVMGDPAGKKEDFPKAIEAFIEETDRWCYQPVFYEAREEMVMLLHNFGYDFIKMGEEALVDLATFSTAGKKMRGTRAVFNKITKEGFTFEVLQPPFDQETMVVLKNISEEWLEGRKERGFSLGFFSEDYLQRNPLAVVKNSEDEIVSFANIIPSYNNEITTIDLMRHHPAKAPSGSMDFLFLHLFEYMKGNFQSFDLGMAPLANVGTSRKSFIQERIASLIYSFGSHFYSFQGLRDYKEKYASQWVPRYTLYSRDSWIVYVMIALLILDNKPIE